MKKHALILIKDGEESIHLLKSEKTILGRDKSCDIVLDDLSVSRKHAALIFRFEKIYIENVSPSGQIFKGSSPFEYAELNEDEEVHIGPYVLTWRKVDESALEKPSPEKANSEADSDSDLSPQVYDAPIVASNENVGFDLMVPDSEESSAMPKDDFALISSSEVTQVSLHQAFPKIRIIKGEDVGREIKLDAGSIWVVGRSRKAHIYIENQKLSRQHFKIIKINNRFRIQDMGSSSGTRLNGVAVADAPLQPFDSIQAGPVEFQFLLVESGYNQVSLPQPKSSLSPSLEPLDFQEQPFASSQNSTLVNVPVPFSAPNETFKTPQSSTTHEAINEEPWSESGNAEENINDSKAPAWLKRLRKQQKIIIHQWKELPPNKRRIYSGIAAVFVLAILLSGMGDTAKTPDNLAENKPSDAEDVTINVAQSPDISPTYYALSIDKQNLIRKLYADAERAESKGQWQEALDASSKILEYVDKYKKTKDIMLQAQSQINESYFKNSGSVADAKDAADRNRDQIKIYMETGNTALQEKRWRDAEEAFISALTLDPNNTDAQQRLLAARNKDPNGQYVISQEPTIEVDPEQEIKDKEIALIQSLKTQYQIASDYIRGPDFRKSIPILKELNTKLVDLKIEYKQGRGPASIRDDLSLNAQKLLSLVEEGYDQALSQLDIEYQTQLADAGQYTANRQYVQARQQYDQILAREPLYEKVRIARQVLYEKMISEAKNLYRGAVIYESVGDLRAAVAGLQKTIELLDKVSDYEAVEYYLKAESRLSYLKR